MKSLRQEAVAFHLIKLDAMLKCQAKGHYCKSLNKVDHAPYFYVTMAKALDVTSKRHTVYKNWSLVTAKELGCVSGWCDACGKDASSIFLSFIFLSGFICYLRKL